MNGDGSVLIAGVAGVGGNTASDASPSEPNNPAYGAGVADEFILNASPGIDEDSNPKDSGAAHLHRTESSCV